MMTATSDTKSLAQRERKASQSLTKTVPAIIGELRAINSLAIENRKSAEIKLDAIDRLIRHERTRLRFAPGHVVVWGGQ